MSGWISPTGASGWVDSNYARDGDLGTEAYKDVPPYEWGAFLILTHASFYCTKVRYHVSDNTTATCLIDVDVYYSGGWHHLYEGGYTEDIWIEKTLPSGQFVTQARVRFYTNKATQARFYVHEVEFYQITIPTAPSGCAAQYVATNKSKCTWNDNSNNETGFHLQVDINDAGFAVWKDVGANVEDSGNHTTGADKKIRFRVCAYNAAGSSAWSTSGYVYTTPDAPSGCAIVLGTINVSWTDNSGYETGFKVERKLDAGDWTVVQTLGANVESWGDTSYPSPSYERYQYRVRSYKGSLYSAYSTSNVLWIGVHSKKLGFVPSQASKLYGTELMKLGFVPSMVLGPFGLLCELKLGFVPSHISTIEGSYLLKIGFVPSYTSIVYGLLVKSLGFIPIHEAKVYKFIVELKFYDRDDNLIKIISSKTQNFPLINPGLEFAFLQDGGCGGFGFTMSEDLGLDYLYKCEIYLYEEKWFTGYITKLPKIGTATVYKYWGWGYFEQIDWQTIKETFVGTELSVIAEYILDNYIVGKTKVKKAA